ncbi:MAG: MBL fold metallo-hydrolase [Anaerolineales bacterium]|nr:MBL fold metallo-hydrolase [Anaerolineales bacterium]
MLNIHVFTLGPVSTNTYIVADSESKQAVIIDPAWDGEFLVDSAISYGYKIVQLWITHAHFDHIGGVDGILKRSNTEIPIALHPLDLPLWQTKGGASLFGIELGDMPPKPQILLEHGQKLVVGKYDFDVLFAPGHTPGHVLFSSKRYHVLFCGDVIFQGSIGRTDLPGGDFNTLMESIKNQVLSLPDNTRLLSGHGPETTVGKEKDTNPYLIP